MRKWIQLIVTLLVIVFICMPLTTVNMDRVAPAVTVQPTVIAQSTALPGTAMPEETTVPGNDAVADAAPTAVPTAVPAAEPTAVPTPEVSATPTAEPTAVPELPANLPVNNGSRDAEGETTVKEIQQRLIDLNYLFDVADGAFGNNSTNAVFAFQAANGLPEYGVVDDVTYYALFSDTAIAGPEPTPTPMGRGSSGNEVIEVQTQLGTWGFLPFEPDGKFGEGTQKGVKNFQQYLHDYGNTLATLEMPELLAVDATVEPTATPEPTPEPTATPEPTPVPAETPVPTLPAGLPLMIGSKDSTTGGIVSQAQQRLVDLGYLSGGVDGAYGEGTANAVRSFQRAFGITETGTIGPQTWPVLFSYSAASVTPAPTLEPTPTPYAPDGVVDDELLEFVRNGRFDVYRKDVRNGDQNDEAFRVQRRLASLNYMYTSACDGAFGATTELALKYFQRLNRLPETGVADEETQLKLFDEMAIRSDYVVYPYRITVDVSDQRTYVYKWTGDAYTSDPVKTFICSTGTKKNPTPLGTYSADGIATQDRWYYFKDFNCYAQYAFRIFGGILFHSVTFSEPDEKTISKGALRNLGRAASHGCIRLTVEDAKWIYDNCPEGFTVTIQE